MRALASSSLLVVIIVSFVCQQSLLAQGARRSSRRPQLSREMRDLAALRKDVLRGSQSPSGENAAKLRKWYENRLKTMATSREQMPAIRQEIINDLRTARTADARRFLISELMNPKGIAAVILGHPKISIAAKVNAMLIFGQLNDSEGDLRSGTLPVPSAAARKLMLATLNDKQSQDAVKIAAIVGLQRHVEFDPQSGKEIVPSMMRILASSPPASGKSDGHYWMQRRAAEILGLYGRDASNGQITVALDKLARDTNAPLSARCAAIDALALIRPSPSAAVDLDETIKSLGSLALASTKAEVERLQAWEEEQLTAQSGRFDEEPGRFGAEDEQQVSPDQEIILEVQRRLGYQLMCMTKAFSATQGRGVLALAKTPDEQNKVKAVAKGMQDMLRSLNQRNVVLADLKTNLATGADALARDLGLAANLPAASTETTQPVIEDPFKDPFGE